ncbi:MAG: WG repeat-containing protein [Bacteroidales bacterium]|nr:WG repeat-containing protein [Bacteroidales bacterium]
MKKFLSLFVLLLIVVSPLSAQHTNVRYELTKRYKDVGYYDKKDQGFNVYNEKGKVGWCDSTGREIIAPQKYDLIIIERDKNDGSLLGYRVRLNEKYGYCDVSGKEIVAPKYDNVYSAIDKKDKKLLGYHVGIDGKYGLCNTDGKEIIPTKYDAVHDGILSNKKTSLKGFGVFLNDKVGCYNSNGKQLFPPVYDTYWYYETDGEVYFKVSVNDKYGLVDTSGNKLTEVEYSSIGQLSEGLCSVEKNGKWGFISIKDGSVSVVVPIEYDRASKFQDGVARVSKNDKEMLMANPLKVVTRNSTEGSGKNRAVSTYPAPDSDVDRDIPNGPKADNNTFAFIIANENYPVAKVPYALNDGWMFEQYCRKTLGIKDENIHLFEDATAGNIIACVEQIKQAAKNANGQATIVFYYAGHAFPDEERNTAYLLPVDGDSKNIATGYSLEKFYKELNSVPTRQLVCFIDACFSGATRDDQMLIGGRGVAIKVKDEIPQGNMVVMTSATGAETAHSFEEMHHGLFTYYLLQKLQETKGDISLGDLSDYVTKMVKRKSVLINQKKQTPTVIPSPKMQSTWREIKL